MKRYEVLTLFPQLFQEFGRQGILGRASGQGLLHVECVNLREYGLGKHRFVDDAPYGGGAGMVLRPEPIFAAAREREALHAKAGRGVHKILLTPTGKVFDQKDAERLAEKPEVLFFISGRYEGFDERIALGLADEALSLGRFVCFGGEVAAMAMIEASARLLPGVLANPLSLEEESFSLEEGLEYPQYTRPRNFEGMEVPGVLFSGDHAKIKRWRKSQSKKEKC